MGARKCLFGTSWVKLNTKQKGDVDGWQFPLPVLPSGSIFPVLGQYADTNSYKYMYMHKWDTVAFSFTRTLLVTILNETSLFFLIIEMLFSYLPIPVFKLQVGDHWQLVWLAVELVNAVQKKCIANSPMNITRFSLLCSSSGVCSL